MTNLAEPRVYRGKPVEAETLDRQVLEARRPLLGPVHLSTLDSMNNLALSLQEQG
jgi:hypothetical protein